MNKDEFEKAIAGIVDRLNLYLDKEVKVRLEVEVEHVFPERPSGSVPNGISFSA